MTNLITKTATLAGKRPFSVSFLLKSHSARKDMDHGTLTSQVAKLSRVRTLVLFAEGTARRPFLPARNEIKHFIISVPYVRVFLSVGRSDMVGDGCMDGWREKRRRPAYRLSRSFTHSLTLSPLVRLVSRES